MLWLIPLYLLIGGAAGAALIFLWEGKCPTNGELVNGVLVGALFWLPLLGLCALMAPFGLITVTCEWIGETPQWSALKKWWKRPICKPAR